VWPLSLYQMEQIMQRFDEVRDNFMRALTTQNWNDVVVHSTDLLLMDDKLAWVWANRGVGLLRLGHPLDAILNFDRAIALEENAIGYNNKGAAFFNLEKMNESLACYEKAAKIDEMPETYLNIGHIHKWFGDEKETGLQNNNKAIAAYRKSIELNPDYADGHLALSLMLLKNGYFQEGWKEYEWRWKSDQLVPRGIKKPQWKGEDLTNKTLLIYAEQGLGDIIQFARYARIVAQKFPRCKIIIEAKQAVRRLLETIPEVYAVINFGEKLPDVDYVVPMMTLAGLFSPSVNLIPAFEREYLLQNRDVEFWGDKLQPLFERSLNALRVGICWAGMSRTANPMATRIDSLRSTSLETFALLAKIPNVLWVSLQKGPPSSQVKTPPAGMTIGDFTEDMYDFYETCCAIANCDLVISVDTAVLHAAASIGKPTWLLSRWDGCWRWLGTRQDSPWYPTLRQFTQPAPHDWKSMIEEVAVELLKLTKEKEQAELDLTLPT
jgi:tetratricopeptide (TPR) repeat protein